MVVTPEFWRDRRVFLTGHTGFKGGWLSLMLSHLSAKTIGYALEPPTTPSLFGAAGIASTLHDTRADVTDLPTLVGAMRASRPEVLIHMAAQSLVKTGYSDPALTYAVNVMGAVNVLEAARHVPSLCVVLIVTTDKCYENHDQIHGYRETDRLGGHDPYSSSKACAELITSAFRDSYFSSVGKDAQPVAIVSARAGNVIGGGDFAANRIVPDAVRAFMAGEPLNVRSPGATRPWQHVLDPLYGYLMLIEKAFGDRSSFSQGWNFGPGPMNERDVETLVTRFIAAWEPSAIWQRDRGSHPHEAHVLRLDTTKARAKLGWVPLLDFDEMINWTAQWYKAYVNKMNIRNVTLEQVRRYFSLRYALPAAEPVEEVIDADR
jgi:CDP-glucose 4,6-dehydratase